MFEFEYAKIRDTLYEQISHTNKQRLCRADRDPLACRFDLERLWSAEDMNG
jgi:hypothetical protein